MDETGVDETGVDDIMEDDQTGVLEGVDMTAEVVE